MANGILNVPGGGTEPAAPSKTTFLADWDATVTYAAGDGCYANGQLYKGLLDANLAQDPLTATTYWQAVASESGPPTKAEVEAVLTGEIASHSHAATHELPVGGTAGQVLSKIDGTDYSVQWSNGGSAVTAGDFLTLTGDTLAVVKEIQLATYTDVSTGAVTATASAVTEGSPANAFTSGADYWSRIGLPAWVQAQLSTQKTVVKYSIRNRVDAWYGQAPATWELLGSNDGTNWTTLDAVSGNTGWIEGETREFTIDMPQAFSYYRLTTSAVSNSGVEVGISYLVLYESDGANNTRLDDTIQGKNIPMPIAANDGQVISYNNATESFVYADSSGEGIAADITVVDAGAYFSGTDAESVLQEIGSSLAGKAAADHTHTEMHELPIGGTTGQILSKTDETDYSVQWVDVSSTGEAFEVYTDLSSGFEGFEGAPLVSHSGQWILASDTPFSGSKCLKSTSITNGSTSESFTFASAAGDLSFWYKVGSELNCDKFTAFLDGVTIINAVSGIIGWTQFVTTIQSGNHTLTFIYSKDGSVDTNGDAVWIDDINFMPVGRVYNQNITEHSGMENMIGNQGKLVIVNATADGITYADRVASNLPTGGLTGQSLIKVDGADFNAQWGNPTPSKNTFISVWDETYTYGLDDACYYNGKFYKSLIGSNSGNNPVSATTSWSNISVGGSGGARVSGIYTSDAFNILQSIGSISDNVTNATIGTLDNYKVFSGGSLSLLLHMNGSEFSQTFEDDRGDFSKPVYNRNVTKSFIPTTPADEGMVCFGGNSYLSIPDSEDFNFGSGNFSIELYFMLTSTTTDTASFKYILGQRTTATSNNAFNVYIQGGTPNKIYLSYTYAATATTARTMTFDYDFKPYQMYHLFLFRNGISLGIYINGKFFTANDFSDTSFANSTNPLTIGAGNGGSADFFTGLMQEFRIVKGNIPYGIAFIPTAVEYAADAYDVLLMHMNGADLATSFTDETGKTCTVSGNTQTKTAQYKLGVSSAYLDGTGDWLTFQNSSDFEFGSDDFTIEFFINPSDSTSRQILGNTSVSTYNGGFGISIGSNVIIFNTSTDGLNRNVTLTSKIVITTSKWYHIAVVRSGNVFTLFLNGCPVDQVEASGAITPAVENFYIGAGGYGYASTYSGYIDEVRISKGIARYAGRFNSPTAPLDPSEVPGTVLLIHGSGATNAGISDSCSVPKTITKVGSPFVWNDMNIIGGNCAFFDGLNFLRVPYSSDLCMYDSNFTIDCWINMTELPTSTNFYTILGQRDGSYYTSIQLSVTNNAGTMQFVVDYMTGTSQYGTINQVKTNYAFLPNNWYHVAVVRNSGTITMYVNGTSIGTIAIGTAGLFNSTTAFLIGAQGSYSKYFKGFIKEIRVLKGYAAWTSNFTPNTVEYLTTY